MMRSQWCTKSSAYGEHCDVYSEISTILGFSRRWVTKRWDLAIAVIILENPDVRRLELWDLAAKTKLLGTESCGKRTKRTSLAYRDGVRPGLPTVNVTAQCVLGSSPVLAMFFGFSALGTVCCLSGKSVKLTGLREFSQIMRPVSSLEISFKNVNSYFWPRNWTTV